MKMILTLFLIRLHDLFVVEYSVECHRLFYIPVQPVCFSWQCFVNFCTVCSLTDNDFVNLCTVCVVVLTMTAQSYGWMLSS